MSKFSNAENKKLAEKNGATLIGYSNNPGETFRERAIELHNQGKIVYYETDKKGTHLYSVDNVGNNLQSL